MAASVGDLKGYDHQFVEPPSNDLLCLICLCVARDPQQINCCGKLLCKGCLEEHKECSGDCPQCRKPINTFSDKRSERDILSLNALCDNTPSGCEWVGELRSLDEHLASCGFTLLPCPNGCHNRSKVVQLLRKDMEKHTKGECPRRQYECPHCQEAGEHREMTTTKHLQKCPMIEIPCPKRRCKTRIVRRDLSKHRQECMFEKVPCKYSTIGCEEEVERKDLAEHEGDTQQHLQLAVDTVHQLRRERADPSKHIQMPMKYILTNYDKHRTANDEIFTPAFYTSPKGYKMCIRVDANGNGDGKDTHVSVFAFLMKGENDDYLPWPFTGTVTVELLNQLEDKNHYSRSTIFPPNDKAGQRVVDEERSSLGWGLAKYISHSDLGHNTAKNLQYLKDDRLYFKISVNRESSSTPWLI